MRRRQPLVRPFRDVEVRGPETICVFGVFGRELRNRAERVRDTEPIVEALTRVGELRVGDELARHQPNGVQELQSRLAVSLERDQARSGHESCGSVRWIELGGGVEFDERVGVAPAFAEHEAEIVMNERTLPPRRPGFLGRLPPPRRVVRL